MIRCVGYRASVNAPELLEVGGGEGAEAGDEECCDAHVVGVVCL